MVSCGGSQMTGTDQNLVKKRERQQPAGQGSTNEDADAKDPQVVTGAYLTCDRSPKDAVNPEMDAIGCSVYSGDGSLMASGNQNMLKFFKRFQTGSYMGPNLVSTASGFQALFMVPKHDTPNTKFIASYKNQHGFDELTCDGSQLPCKKSLEYPDHAAYLGLDISGLWQVNDGIVGEATKALRFVDSHNFCDRNSRGETILKINQSPAANAVSGSGFDSILDYSTNKITAARRIYASRNDVCVIKVKDQILGSTKQGQGFSSSGNGCHVALMEKRSGSRIPIDGMSSQSQRLSTKRFTIILKATQMSAAELEESLRHFACK
jgi:hypothetical protein